MNDQERKDSRERIRAELRKEIQGLPGVTSGEKYSGAVPTGMRRRGSNRTRLPARPFTLFQDAEGVLVWEPGTIAARGPAMQRRGYRGAAFRGDVVDHLVIDPLEPSWVNRKLEEADQKLTPSQGLLEWKKSGLVPLAPGSRKKQGKGKRILLIVHGTFSESQPIFDQLGSTVLGPALKTYDQILAFNHPTLSMSPVMNALDLSRHMEGEEADIDVVCHSRGGLVSRWWLEELDRPGNAKRRAMVFGAPLEGTSLASPPHLRHLLSWFSNLADRSSTLPGSLTPLVPWMKVVSLLSQFTAIVTNVAASTPVIDAAVALMPGLESMSRISNNFELDRLNRGAARDVDYFIVTANYVPSDPGWKFWEYFGNVAERVRYKLFDGISNDTVVDCKSMEVFRPGTIVRRHEFPRGDTVHHTNYFAQQKTRDLLLDWINTPRVRTPRR